MENQIVIVCTDEFCKLNKISLLVSVNIPNHNCYKKEVFKIQLILIKNPYPKKVGPPTLVINPKNVQKSFKKAGINKFIKENTECNPIQLTPQAYSPLSTTWPTCPGTTRSLSWFSLSWTYSVASINKLMKMINGNRKKGYNLGLWNCKRGLTDGNGEPSRKMSEVREFIQKNLHMLCLIEADLHSATS